ncbi:hypothetical protein ACW4TU_04050 [Streptomyces sp. QTS52]
MAGVNRLNELGEFHKKRRALARCTVRKPHASLARRSALAMAARTVRVAEGWNSRRSSAEWIAVSDVNYCSADRPGGDTTGRIVIRVPQAHYADAAQIRQSPERRPPLTAWSAPTTDPSRSWSERWTLDTASLRRRTEPLVTQTPGDMLIVPEWKGACFRDDFHLGMESERAAAALQGKSGLLRDGGLRKFGSQNSRA